MKLITLLSTITTASAFLASTPPNKPVSFLRETVEDEAEAAVEFKGAESFSSLTSEVETIFSSEQIAEILPHRYPFLLVDKVIEYEPSKVCKQCPYFFVLL